MKPSTLKCLSTAIALPLFASTLSLATPVSAEQIDFTSSSFSEPRATDRNRIPAVTDLNLSVPVARQSSSSATPVRSNASHKHSKTSSDDKHFHRSVSTQNVATVGRSNQVKSISSRNNLVAMNITPATSKITGVSSKSQPSSNRRIAAVSPPPFSGNYLRLVRDPSNRTNALGNPIYILEVYRNGIIYQKFSAVSGTVNTQNRDRSIPEIAAPLQDGLYTVSGQIVPGRGVIRIRVK